MPELIQLIPFDEHNRRLQASVQPPDWVNPTPADRYNLVVIGAGTAGLVTAAGAAGLGARVALVERELMGGDCLNVGCVPSKALVSAGRAAAEVKAARHLGIRIPEEVSADFGLVMERMRRLRADISPNDSAERFRRMGVDVYLGSGRFTGVDSVEVDGRTLRFSKAVIATGARPSAPPIPGLDEVPYLTNVSVFSLTALPGRLGVIGAGPIGCELAQSFARFGSEVYLIEAAHGILPREDRDAASIVQKALGRDGVRLLCCGKDTRVLRSEKGIRVRLESHEQSYDIEVDQLLVAAGRTPNVEGLELDRVGVEYDRRGIRVDDRLQTTNSRIFAAGDVCSPYKFTHAADFLARLVIQNALFLGRAKASSLVIPWCTYTSPEIAHVGLSTEEAQEKGIVLDTFEQEFRDVDRAILEGETEGLVRISVRKGTDRIAGATIVARNAGDLISEVTLAIKYGIGLSKIASTIHPYPTQAEAIRKVGDAYNRTRLTPLVKTVFERWLSWTR